MSSNILLGSTLAYLSNFIADLHNVGFNGLHISVTFPDEFTRTITDTNGRANPGKVFAELYNFNRKAYLTRYPAEADETPTAEEIGGIKEYNAQIHDFDYQVQKWHYQIFKSLQCYIYQCTESEELINSSTYKAIQAVETALMHYIIEQSPEYQAANWC